VIVRASGEECIGQNGRRSGNGEFVRRESGHYQLWGEVATAQAVNGDDESVCGSSSHHGNRRERKNRLLLLAADCVGKPLQALKEALTGCSTTTFVGFVGRQKVEYDGAVVDEPWVDIPQAITHSVQSEFLCDLGRGHSC